MRRDPLAAIDELHTTITRAEWLIGIGAAAVLLLMAATTVYLSANIQEFRDTELRIIDCVRRGGDRETCVDEN